MDHRRQGESMMMLASNLEGALVCAIEYQRQLNGANSSFVQGLNEALKALRRGEKIDINYRCEMGNGARLG